MKIIILKSYVNDPYCDCDPQTMAAMYDLAVDVSSDEYFKLKHIVDKYNSNI